MRYYFTTILILLQVNFLSAQVVTSSDSVQTLQEIIVKAYEQNRKLMQVPTAIAVITQPQLLRFNNTNILPALNSNPGIRMEERSPGSYRLNIRGSSLRSPFGVRNVKTYYNDIPYTDPGGNTYLNQLGFYNIRSAEVIKGPGSSLYGAGTGGVLLLNTNQANWHPGLSFDFSAGSFALNNLNTNLRLGTEAVQNTLNYLQLSSNSYRDHSEVDRKVFTWDLNAHVSEKGRITAHFLWSDLFYQTPGALTLSEYRTNPKGARPRVGQTPGSSENKAAIFQKIFLAGITFNQKISEHIQNTTSFYGASTRLLNPTIRNYGRTSEPHTGGRTFFQFDKKINERSKLNIVTGVEFQQGLSSVRIYSNKTGNPDTLQTDDEINNRVFFAFAQATLELPKDWFITAGASLNSQNLAITRLSTSPVIEQKRKYKNKLAPRLAILKQLTSSLSAYASVARGFSPPTTAEILPSSGIIATGLDPEDGINYEAGLRGDLNRRRIYFDINAFYFALKNTIVQRRDANGADYFVNAGSTKQLGLETYLSWQLLNNPRKMIADLKISISHTWNDFTYKEFKQVNTDFSGNELPSVPPQIISAGVDLVTKPGVYLNINYYYADPIPLNDANTEYASSYNLLGARTGWKKHLHPKVLMDLFLAADNIFDVTYSLGNDINAFGGRYYNAAAPFNFAGGIALHFNFK
ncbi:MAG TPA: TonB-dependent receptor plug domain-containing protein [Chitinophagaceae bacterium]|nr:TonB-dependent receptor plug domain-containing protein [Chitinophagaceae bacterium]